MLHIEYFDALFLKISSAGAIIGGFFSLIIQTVSSNSVSFWQTIISVVGAGVVSLSALLVKSAIDRRKADRDAAFAAHRTDAVVGIDKEKLVDARISTLIDDMTNFYAARQAQSESIIELQKSMLANCQTIIDEQRILITQLNQAKLIAPIVDGKK